MSEWKGPWKCEKCGKEYLFPVSCHAAPPIEDDQLHLCDGKMLPHDRRTADPEKAELSESDLIRRVTRAVREADQEFKKVGGSSRHWVRECFLPCLEAEGLKVVDALLRRTEGGEE